MSGDVRSKRFSFSETESHPVEQTDLEFASSNVNILVLG